MLENGSAKLVMTFADQTSDLAFCDVGWIESDTAHSVNSKSPIVTAHSVNSFGNVPDSTPCVTQIQSQHSHDQ